VENDYLAGGIPKEKCGVFGIIGHSQAAWLTYLGLYALQHRGQEACGIVSNNKGFFSFHRGMGLVNEVFNEGILHQLKGDMAVGHVRYSTTGASLIKNTQPLVMECARGTFCIAHNGNLVNSWQLRQDLRARGAIFQTTTDSELIVHLLAHSPKGDLKSAFRDALQRIKGAYSLVMMNRDTLIGVRDTLGFRPLVLGRIGKAWCLASETCAFDLVGATFVREVEPGEVIFITKKGTQSFLINKRNASGKNCAFCAFEHIYFSRPDSVIFGQNVHLVRVKLGEALAREHPQDADLVIPVPDSGLSAALGYSRYSGIPLELGIVRNHYIGRTFIQPSQDIRNFGVRVKFNLLPGVLKGKRIIVVDDSIVRGTTSKIRIRNLRQAGAKEVHLRITCPAHRFPCFYGIDFHESKELIANRLKTLKKIQDYLEVDSLGYLSLEGMLSCFNHPSNYYCTACWTGKYPIQPKEKQEKMRLETKSCGQGEV